MDTLKQLIASEGIETRAHITAAMNSLQVAQLAETAVVKLQRSLRFEEMYFRQSQIKQSYPNTFNWIFEPGEEHSSFKAWLLSDQPLFWVNGKAGSGKSTLMEFLVRDHRLAELLPDHSLYSFFFWSSSHSEMQRSQRGMLCSLLYQMMEANITYAGRLLQGNAQLSRKQHPQDWGLEELESALQFVLNLHEKPVCLFIDGLDEMGSQVDTFDVRRLTTRTISSVPNLKICVSSRPEPKWEAMLRDCPSLRLQDLTRKDLEIVAHDLLHKYFEILVKKEPETEVDTLVDLLTWKSSGVFLWLHQALRSIQIGLTGRETLDELKERIEKTPDELKDLYRSMLARLGSETDTYQHHASHCFRFILEWYNMTGDDSQPPKCFHLSIARDAILRKKLLTARKQFFRSQEFLDACDRTQKQIEIQCAGLLEFRASREDKTGPLELRVEFIHRTAKDFLLTTQEGSQLIGNCSVEYAQMAVTHTLLCEALVNGAVVDQRQPGFENRRYGYSHEIFLSKDWARPRCRHLESIIKCCAKLEESGSSLWKTSAAEMTTLIEESFKQESLNTCLEEAAAYGLIYPIQIELVSKDKLGVPKNPLLNYLVWERVRFGSSYRWNLDARFMKWAWGQGADPHWHYIHSARLNCQIVPFMLNSWQSRFLEAFEGCRSLFHWYTFFREYRHQVPALRQKIVIPHSFCDSWYRWQSKKVGMTSVVTEERSDFDEIRLTDVLVEYNLPRLFNDTILRGLRAVDLRASLVDKYLKFKPDVMDDLKKLELREMMYPPQECHRKVLLIGDCSHEAEGINRGPTLERFYRMYNSTTHSAPVRLKAEPFRPEHARFCAPTEKQGSLLLDALDAALGEYLEHFYDGDRQHYRKFVKDTVIREKALALHDAVRDLLSTGDNRIASVADSLRAMGHYIPTEQKVEKLQRAPDVYARACIMNELNQEMLEFMKSTQDL